MTSLRVLVRRRQGLSSSNLRTSLFAVASDYKRGRARPCERVVIRMRSGSIQSAGMGHTLKCVIYSDSFVLAELSSY